MTDRVVTGPLVGWRVLVPRSPDRSGSLVEALAAVGARAVPVPLIAIGPPADPDDLDRQVLQLAAGRFAWVAFTSINAVDAVLHRAAALAVAPAVPVGTRVAAVGPSTADRLRSAGLPVELMPVGRSSGAALGAIWPPASPGESVLLPRSDLAAADLPNALVAKGFRVELVDAYRTVAVAPPAAVCAELAAGDFDAVLLTSPSTVAALAGVEIASRTVLVAIGSPTAAAIRSAGRSVDVIADSPTPTALVDGLAAFAATRRLQEK